MSKDAPDRRSVESVREGLARIPELIQRAREEAGLPRVEPSGDQGEDDPAPPPADYSTLAAVERALSECTEKLHGPEPSLDQLARWLALEPQRLEQILDQEEQRAADAAGLHRHELNHPVDVSLSGTERARELLQDERIREFVLGQYMATLRADCARLQAELDRRFEQASLARELNAKRWSDEQRRDRGEEPRRDRDARIWRASDRLEATGEELTGRERFRRVAETTGIPESTVRDVLNRPRPSRP